jgi:membrane protease YdiL (CAAX protease family)
MSKEHNMVETKSKLFAAITFSTSLLVQVFIWFVLYPFAGYSDKTLFLAQSLLLFLGIGLIYLFKLNWGKIGAGVSDFIWALIGITISHLAILVIVFLGNLFMNPIQLFRTEYSLYAISNNWLLTGFGEELIFSGLLFNLLTHAKGIRHRWLALLLTAFAFSLWHLPGYLAVGLRFSSLGSDLIFDLILRMLSWGFFGTIYMFSDNLWLAAFAHASTDYALLPVIINSAVYGLVFLSLTIVVARWLKKKQMPKYLVNLGS